MITAASLRLVVPAAGARADTYAAALAATAEEFGIWTLEDTAAFISQVAHESAAFRSVSENLNYSAGALRKVFGKYFTDDEADAYARKPEMIANRVYANRMGNGDEASGDGWLRRGAGLIQTTGTKNHRAVAEYFGVPFHQIGDWLRTTEGATRSAGFYWWSNGLSAIANEPDFDGVCALVNTGDRRTRPARVHGYADRLAHYERGLQHFS